MKHEIENGRITLELDFAALLEDAGVAKALMRYHAYEEDILNCLAQIATTGEVDWGEDEVPWRSYWTGRGETFERLRLLVTSIAEPTAQKLIADLKKERDELFDKTQKLQNEVWSLNGELREARRAA